MQVFSHVGQFLAVCAAIDNSKPQADGFGLKHALIELDLFCSCISLFLLCDIFNDVKSGYKVLEAAQLYNSLLIIWDFPVVWKVKVLCDFAIVYTREV